MKHHTEPFCRCELCTTDRRQSLLRRCADLLEQSDIEEGRDLAHAIREELARPRYAVRQAHF